MMIYPKKLYKEKHDVSPNFNKHEFDNKSLPSSNLTRTNINYNVIIIDILIFKEMGCK